MKNKIGNLRIVLIMFLLFNYININAIKTTCLKYNSLDIVNFTNIRTKVISEVFKPSSAFFIDKIDIQNNNPKKSKGIKFFKGTWEEALALAKKENKLIFLDAYASWCGPCKMMKSKVFSKSTPGILFNENFINVAIDMEKGDGKFLSRKYEIKAYPTLLFIDYKGNAKQESIGYHNERELISFAKDVLK